jgi:hypothetical protein
MSARIEWIAQIVVLRPKALAGDSPAGSHADVIS